MLDVQNLCAINMIEYIAEIPSVILLEQKSLPSVIFLVKEA